MNELAAIEAALSTYSNDQRPAVLINGSLGDIEVIREALCANAWKAETYRLYIFQAKLHVLEYTGSIDEFVTKRVTVDILTRFLIDRFNVFKVVREPLLGQLVRKPCLPSARVLSTVLSYSNWPGMDTSEHLEPGLWRMPPRADRQISQ